MAPFHLVSPTRNYHSPTVSQILSVTGGDSTLGNPGVSPHTFGPTCSLSHGLLISVVAVFSIFRSIFTLGVHEKKGTVRSTKTKPLELITDKDAPDDEMLTENPLWPTGVFNKDVDEIVNECLKDKNINIASMPDFLERQLYRSTIKLTVNALYRSLSGIHGHKMLGHEFRVTRIKKPRSQVKSKMRLLDMRSDVAEELLENVADRLLANKSVNQALIPDAIERPLYVNCLKIVFRVLDLLVSSFRITLCGHDISIQLEPSQRYSIQEEALKRATASLTGIDMEAMKEIAREAGVDVEEEDRQRWFWQRMFSPMNNDFVAQIHASLYSLILAIIDDLLGNTELDVISDRIGFELVVSNGQTETKMQQRSKPNERKKGKGRYSLAFIVGLGLGLILSPSHLLDAVQNAATTMDIIAFRQDGRIDEESK